MPLDPKISKHSTQNALALAKASQLAYSDQTAVKAGLPAIIGQPVRDFKFFTSGIIDTNCFLAGFDDSIVLAFRGSKSL